MGKIRLILWREFTSRIKKRSFIVMSILGPLIISLFVYLAIQVSDSYKQYEVLVVDPHGITGEWNMETKWCNYTRTKVNQTDAEFKTSKYDVLLYVNKKFAENNTLQAFYREKVNPYVRADILHESENRLEGLKLELHDINANDYYQIKQRVNLKDKMIDGSDVEFTINSGAIGFVFGGIIFFFIFNFGMQVMRGVIEEKNSRIVEIIISSAKPMQLMTGKILGIGLTALTQFFIWAALTTAILVGFKDKIYEDPFDARSVQVAQSAQYEQIDQAQFGELNEVAELFYQSDFTGPLMFFLFFLIVGYLFYAGIFASIGSAVDNDTDVQQFLFPVTLPLMFGFVVAWLAATQPDSTVVLWCSQIPFTSPIVMMVRLVIGFESGDVWQLYSSMGILLVSAIVMFSFSARIYRTGILMYGKKANISEIWRWAIKGE